MHRLSKNIYFIVMINVDRKAGAIRNDTIVRCDLKGSWVGRRTRLDPRVLAQHIIHPSPNTPPVNCKDKDIQEGIAHHTLKLPLRVEPQDIAVWTTALQEDAHFLARNNLMDYSLLLVFYRTGPPSVSIIDYLQDFNARKRLEVIVKSLRRRRCPTFNRIHGISCSAPLPYAVRFSRNLSRLLETGALYDTRPQTFESFAGATEHAVKARRWTGAGSGREDRHAGEGKTSPAVLSNGPGSSRDRSAAPPPPPESDEIPLTL
eukprot:TRINITY_DN2499_c0_g1_i1.p2 TRINITY_DN2499_c0_g1~~TRINITY_DN2499_c0_g1_i1.p2  ORF type:complete len:261 (-),score=64.83 TRINITY_DN2499_c0_g1_i1:153-935(-)